MPKAMRPLRVTFSPQVAVYPTLHIDDFSEREMKESWYSRDEITVIREECIATVRMVVQKKPLRTDMYCARGLEFRTPWGLERRQTNKYKAMDAVLDEQDEQFEENMYDAMAIATVYHCASAHCQEAAHQLGLHDERYVQKVVKHVQRQCITKKQCCSTKEESSPRKSGHATNDPTSNQMEDASRRQDVMSLIQNNTAVDVTTRPLAFTCAAA